MSSNAYFAELRADPALRRFVQWSAAALALVGVTVIAKLEAPLAIRLGGSALWLAILTTQLYRLRRGWSTCAALRVYADGGVAVLDHDGEWVRGQLAPDGVLLRRWGWIRIRPGAGRPFAEPVRGSCRDSHEWRRLHVIWQHVGGGQ